MAKKTRGQIICRYICRSSRNPESLARGIGLGLFIGFLPAVGFQVIIAFFTAGFFNANRLVTVLGTLVTNPFTAVPVSVFSIWLGDWILPGAALAEISIQNFEWSTLFTSPSRLVFSYLLGCLLLSVTGAILGYGGVQVYSKIRSPQNMKRRNEYAFNKFRQR